MIWLYLLNETDLFSTTAKRMLHVAPEAWLTGRFSRAPAIDYVTADLDPARAMVQMDLTDIQLPDESFDVIYCSHVLEHIPDDLRAMRELFRVLRLTGWAVLQVPVWRDVTDEDLSVTDHEARGERFSQMDHVRAYGKDYAERLAQAGFQVTVDPYPRRLGPVWVERYGLMIQEDVYLCRKPSREAKPGLVDRFPSKASAPGPRRHP